MMKTPKIPVDYSNREKVHNDFSTTFWVEAGAGTGKTSLLISRLRNILTREDVRLENIVAITFTEKAAGELKTRLREELEKTRDKSDPRQQKKINRAIGELDYSNIMTIHSFAAAILRERPVEAGVDPRFGIIDEEEAGSLCTGVWEKWFRNALDTGSEHLGYAVKLNYDENRLKELAMLLYKQRDVVEGSTCQEPPVFKPETFIQQMEEYNNRMSLLASTCTNENDGGFIQYGEFSRWFDSARSLKDENLLNSIIYMMPAMKSRGNKSNWSPGENCTLQKDICKEINNCREEAVKIICASATGRVISWLKGFIKAVEEEKKEAGVLDFNDLLIKTRDLLQKNKEVRGYFQRRFRYLLVDEFQDTDPLQAEIIFFLAERKPVASSWCEAEITPGKLFVVGDPKQAIYRFRRADIEIYEKAKELVIKQGEFLNIVQNFRTVPAVINWVNHAFSRLIEPVPGKNYQPCYEDLHPYREDIYDNPASVIMLRLPGEMDEKKTEDKRKQEAATVAEFIKNSIGKMPVSGDSGETRPLRPDDIGILFPATTDLEIYQQALRQKSIYYRLEGGKMFFRRHEVNSFINLLASIDNPYDTVALVSALRNYFGVSDEELLLYGGGGGTLNYLDYANVPEESGLVRRSFEVLYRMHQYKKELSLPRLLNKILHSCGVYSRLFLQDGGKLAVSNLEKIIEISRSLEKNDVVSLRQLVRWLTDKGEMGREESESVLSDKDSSSVQLLTVHRAKGLEFKMVILVNLIAGSGSKKESFVSDRGKSRFELRGGPSGFSTYGYEMLAEEEGHKLEAEKRRLFYVAATRARDYLVIPLINDKKSTGFLKYMNEIESLGGISREMCRTIEPEEYCPEDNDMVSSVGPANDAGLMKTSFDGEKLKRIIAGGSQSLSILSAGELAGDRYISEERETRFMPGEGARFGSAFHRVMERINLSDASAEELKYHVNEAADYWGLKEKEKEKLLPVIKKTLGSSIMERACRNTAYREVPFAVKAAGRLLEGLIDLLFEEPEGFVIVDYKTDDVHGEEMENRFQKYRIQGLFYAFALHEVTGREIKEIDFFFVRSGVVKHIERPSLREIRDIIAQYSPPPEK